MYINYHNAVDSYLYGPEIHLYYIIFNLTFHPRIDSVVGLRDREIFFLPSYS
jgi:hypothetical protein